MAHSHHRQKTGLGGVDGGGVGHGVGFTPVPKFGGWDHKSGSPDYSMVFTKARANRKQNKFEFNHASLGNESEFINRHLGDAQPSRKKKSLGRFLSCCMF